MMPGRFDERSRYGKKELSAADQAAAVRLEPVDSLIV